VREGRNINCRKKLFLREIVVTGEKSVLVYPKTESETKRMSRTCLLTLTSRLFRRVRTRIQKPTKVNVSAVNVEKRARSLQSEFRLPERESVRWISLREDESANWVSLREDASAHWVSLREDESANWVSLREDESANWVFVVRARPI
jgi:hypothetical protein